MGAILTGLAGCGQSGPLGPAALSAGSLGSSVQAFFDRLFHRPPRPVAAVHYVVGSGYPAGGIWYYPREDFSYDRTGIAQVEAGPHAPLTGDGELFDLTAMAAAHQTLQLPAVVRVTNLENGRQVLLRLNDRGPANPARILAVTPRAGQLLAFDADGTARVRVQVESAASQALAASLHGDALAISTAPIGRVQADSLAPPPGARSANRGVPAAAVPAASPMAAADATVPLRLPEAVQQTAAAPGVLWIEAGSFGRAEYARRRVALLAGTGAVVERVSGGGQTSYNVRIGPFDSVGQADATLAQAIRAGVSDARITVE